ncbi:hypothetical protein [Dactylosporangium sp. NPDC048998]|uniref:hypothetical protein n=1 Tax=Dactylosporangium sp. NPDC048998 TaxID=3363976 RepID=UPI0037228A0F
MDSLSQLMRFYGVGGGMSAEGLRRYLEDGLPVSGAGRADLARGEELDVYDPDISGLLLGLGFRIQVLVGGVDGSVVAHPVRGVSGPLFVVFRTVVRSEVRDGRGRVVQPEVGHFEPLFPRGVAPADVVPAGAGSPVRTSAGSVLVDSNALSGAQRGVLDGLGRYAGEMVVDGDAWFGSMIQAAGEHQGRTGTVAVMAGMRPADLRAWLLLELDNVALSRNSVYAVAAARGEGQYEAFLAALGRPGGYHPLFEVLVDVAAGLLDVRLHVVTPEGVTVSSGRAGDPGLYVVRTEGGHYLPALAGSRLGEPVEGDVEPSWPLFLPPGADLLSTVDTGGVSGEVVVVGSGAGEPVGVLRAVRRAAGGVDQPVVVVSVPPGGSPDAGQVDAVRTLLNVYGWRGRVPVVVTRGRLAPLESLLDLYGVSAVYQTSAVGGGLGGRSGGLAALNLSNAWVLRRPAGEPAAAGLSSEVLSAELLQAAAGRRRPVFDRPSTPVASFLSVPLRDTSRIRETYDTYRALLAPDLPQVQQIVSRDPAFAGHQAVLGLAELGQFDAAVAYLQAGDDRPDVIAAPLLNIDRDATPVERQRAVVGMLPHLAALARAVSHDLASEAILLAVADLITENRSQEDVRNDIWFHKNLLPKDGRLRVGWVTHLTELTQQLPEHTDSLGWVASAIMNCPD